MKSAPPEKANPYDVVGLQASLNDSATRVSTIWITYLLFGLYLLVAAGTATHKQLLLEEGLKLPALGTDVPLFWFFVLSPILFVLLHVYVLLQVLLLGRTAAAYSAAVDRSATAPSGNAAMRQRLANTLFAQIFAGSPRERSGWLGRMLQIIAWITLVSGPIVIILALQLAFLPYQSALATWSHRVLIMLELVIAFAFWPIVLDPERELSWERVRRDLKRAGSRTFRLVPLAALGWKGVYLIARRTSPALGCAVIAFISLFVLAFPGERHINFLTFQEIDAVNCDTSLLPHLDRLILKNINVVDPERHKHLLDALEHTSFQKHWEGERTRSFSNRNLNCGIFDFADFRLVSFENSRLSGATLENAKMDAAVLSCADLRNAKLNGVSMDNVNASRADFGGARIANSQLQHALLKGIVLSGADLSLSNLEGTDLGGADPLPACPGSYRLAQLQGVNLASADLAGAVLDSAQMQAATLIRTRLDGASLVGAALPAADLDGAQLQGANLSGADLTLTRLDHAFLQGSRLEKTTLKDAVLGRAYMWDSGQAQCESAFLTSTNFDPVIAMPTAYTRKSGVGKTDLVQATPDAVGTLIKTVPESEDYHPQLVLKELLHPMDSVNLDALRKSCGDNSDQRNFDAVRFAEQVAATVCQEIPFRKEFAAGAIRSAINQQRNRADYLQFQNPSAYFPKLAQLLLPCAGDRLEEVDRLELQRRAAEPAASTPSHFGPMQITSSSE